MAKIDMNAKNISITFECSVRLKFTNVNKSSTKAMSSVSK